MPPTPQLTLRPSNSSGLRIWASAGTVGSRDGLPNRQLRSAGCRREPGFLQESANGSRVDLMTFDGQDLRKAIAGQLMGATDLKDPLLNLFGNPGATGARLIGELEAELAGLEFVPQGVKGRQGCSQSDRRPPEQEASRHRRPAALRTASALGSAGGRSSDKGRRWPTCE